MTTKYRNAASVAEARILELTAQFESSIAREDIEDSVDGKEPSKAKQSEKSHSPNESVAGQFKRSATRDGGSPDRDMKGKS